MKIVWNKVTWYSKLLAVIIFVATFALAFYLGMQYGALRASSTSTQGCYQCIGGSPLQQ